MGPRQNDNIGKKNLNEKGSRKFKYIYDSHGGQVYGSYSPYK